MNSELSASAGIPADTYKAAREIYNLQHVYLQIGDQFEQIFAGANLQRINPRLHASQQTAARLSLVSAFQYAEGLPDPVASEASRKRMDWKYALHLPVHHQGFLSTMLCSFRQELYASSQALAELDYILEQLQSFGLFREATEVPLRAVSVLPVVCQFTRLNNLTLGIKKAISILSAYEPRWLMNNMPPYWYGRYKTGPLRQVSTASDAEMQKEAVRLGEDIQYLLNQLQEQGMTKILDLPEIQNVKHLLAEEFITDEDGFHWQRSECSSSSICCTRG